MGWDRMDCGWVGLGGVGRGGMAWEWGVVWYDGMEFSCVGV